MDETFFCDLVARPKDNIATFIGLEVGDNFVQHKNYVGI